MKALFVPMTFITLLINLLRTRAGGKYLTQRVSLRRRVGFICVTSKPVCIDGLQWDCASNPNHVWSRIQSGDITGAQFNPDFQNNLAVPAPYVTQVDGVATIGFDVGYAYHFYPLSRVSLQSTIVCGTLTVFHARVVPSSNAPVKAGEYVLGLGADYWQSLTAQWDNFKTNKDVAIGRLKNVTETWAWYGLNTASDFDINSLKQNAYVKLK
ncbi:MAG: hypothetical protein WCH44_07840 [Betaproteobacteria bacterium]